MRFRLDNGSVVVLEDSLLDLCQLFRQIHEQVHVFTTLDDTLKDSPYKKVRSEFIDLLKRVLHTVTGSMLPDEDHLRQLSNPDSVLSQTVKREAADKEVLLGCLEYVQVHIDQLLAPLTHRLRFLKDKTLLSVLDYLRLPSERRSNTMFETLPFSYQSCEAQTDFRTLVEASLHPYIDFVEKMDDEMFMDMARASLQLGIPSLAQLIGCRMAKLVNTLNEREIRQRFGVPDDKFVDATKEKLDTILKQQAWLSQAPFVSHNQLTAHAEAAAEATTLPSVTHPIVNTIDQVKL